MIIYGDSIRSTHWIFVVAHHLRFARKQLRVSPRWRILPHTVQIEAHKRTPKKMILI
jgi:hypothetical protein